MFKGLLSHAASSENKSSPEHWKDNSEQWEDVSRAVCIIDSLPSQMLSIVSYRRLVCNNRYSQIGYILEDRLVHIYASTSLCCIY
jgi:hypothetical protein